LDGSAERRRGIDRESATAQDDSPQALPHPVAPLQESGTDLHWQPDAWHSSETLSRCRAEESSTLVAVDKARRGPASSRFVVSIQEPSLNHMW